MSERRGAWAGAERDVRPRSLTHVASGIGSVGAAYIALAWARTHVPPYVDDWLKKHPQLPSPDLVWVPPPPAFERELGKTQPLALALVMGAVAALCLLYVVADVLLAKRRATRPFGWLLRLVLVVGGLGAAWREAPYLGVVALGALLPLALVFACYDQKDEATPERSRSRGVSSSSGVVVLVAEALCLGWSLWLTWSSAGAAVLGGLALLTLSVAAGVLSGSLMASPHGRQKLERDAFIGAPLLALPLLAMCREPSPLWPFAALVGCALLALEARYGWSRRPVRLLARNRRAFAILSAVAAPWAIAAIVMVPMRFRELGDIDHMQHEAQHLGWLNSMTFGRVMMADAGFVYGPLREYMLASIAWLNGGLTIEHVREAHIVVNLLGLALFLYVGWRVARRQPWLHLWWAWILLTETQVALFLKYRDVISFGWNDSVRVASACLALVGATDAITSPSRSEPPKSLFRANRALFSWGILCGVSTLYSQDFGPCAFGAVGLAIAADSWIRRREDPVVDRLRRTVRLGVAWTVGMLLPVALLLAVYACVGKAGLLVRRVITWTGILASASWGGLAFPFKADAYLKWATLASHDDKGFGSIDAIVPPIALILGGALLLTALVRGTWTARTTLLFALFAFGFTSFRHALIRSDVYHLRSDGTGSLLLLFAIGCDLSTVRFRIHPRAPSLPIGAALVAALAVGWTYMEDSWEPLRTKLHQIAAGEESPSQGPKYDNRDVPRAGDANVPANIKALVHYVSTTTTREDPILATGFMTGGELSFILDRRNPIPFDAAQELMTHADQAETLADLKATPPILILGEYFPIMGVQVREFIDAHWKKVEVSGWGTVRRYEAPAASKL